MKARVLLNLSVLVLVVVGIASASLVSPPSQAQTTNLALNKTATASGEETSKGNTAAKGNDGNTSTRWCAANGNTGQWWKVDLGQNYSLTGTEVMWEFSGRVYKYKIEVSTDNTNWTLVVDRTNNTSTAQTQSHSFSATARYVRITVTGLPANTWASFWEFRVFGSSGATATPTRTPTPGPTATPTRTPTPTGTSCTPSSLSIRGADVSSLQRALDLGQKYYYANGTQGHPLDILKSVGVNYIRLRVWVNPASGYNDKDNVVAFAQVVKSKGLKLMIDFHYSDTWADPGTQTKPAAWSSHTLSQLTTDVYNHTLDVCNALKNAGATPDMIQIGNEITNGMLWPEGQITNNNFANLATLLKSAYNAVKACSSSIQVAIHIDKGGDNSTSRWFFDGIKAQGVQWDVTALSYYCYWHGSISSMQSNVADLKSRYGKPVIIVETAYPWTTQNFDNCSNVISSSTPCSGYSASLTGQAANFNAVKQAALNGGAAGVFYWEPTWVATPGNGWDPANISGSGDGWENQAVFDNNAKLNPNICW